MWASTIWMSEIGTMFNLNDGDRIEKSERIAKKSPQLS